jgi:Leucine-rich repeat (LRR) protein
LTTLDLRGTTVTDASLNRLARLHGLAELNLQYTNITSAGAARLARELPETQVRHRSWPSERYRRRCQRLFVAGALIEISEDPARGDCLRLVRERWRGTPEDMAEIAHLNIELLQLESLDLEPEFLASLAALPNLKSLAIGSCRLRDIDFTPLSRSLSLRNIALKDVVVGSPVIEELAQLPQLDSLALVRTRLGPGSLASLSRLTLHKLAIVGTWIREESLFSLAQVKSLRHLELMRVSLPERHLDRLAEVSQLESLALNQIATGDNCVSYLSRLAHLRRLDIDNTLLTPAGAKRLEEALPGCEVNTNTSPRPEFDLVQFFSSSRGA